MYQKTGTFFSILKQYYWNCNTSQLHTVVPQGSAIDVLSYFLLQLFSYLQGLLSFTILPCIWTIAASLSYYIGQFNEVSAPLLQASGELCVLLTDCNLFEAAVPEFETSVCIEQLLMYSQLFGPYSLVLYTVDI